MIRSMTGSGSAQKTTADFDIAVSVKSINNRYLDIILRLPPIIKEYEHVLKRPCIQHLGRGKVEISVSLNDLRKNAVSAALNEPIVKALLDAAIALQDRPGVDGTLDVSSVISFPGALIIEPALIQHSENFLSEVSAVILEGIDDLNRMKDDEGRRIGEDIERRLDSCKRYVSQIETGSHNHKQEYRQKLSQRLQELTQGLEIDPQRLDQEIAFMAERSDISEEIVRLNSHLEQTSNLIGAGGVVGKKLDFLVQEMNREANTIGSKSKNLDINRLVIEVKSEIEKIREQVQNIE